MIEVNTVLSGGQGNILCNR